MIEILHTRPKWKISVCVFSNSWFGVFECSLLQLNSKRSVTFLTVHGRKQILTSSLPFLCLSQCSRDCPISVLFTSSDIIMSMSREQPLCQEDSEELSRALAAGEWWAIVEVEIPISELPEFGNFTWCGPLEVRLIFNNIIDLCCIIFMLSL